MIHPTSCLLIRLLMAFAAFHLSGCASVPTGIASAQEITVLYRQGPIPTEIQLESGGAALGLLGAVFDLQVAQRNKENESKAQAINALSSGDVLLAQFKSVFGQALSAKGLRIIEVPSTGGSRLDIRTHVPSFRREEVRTRWVLQIDEVQTRYSATAFTNYQPWVFVKYAIFDMTDKSLSPIVPLTSSVVNGNPIYQFPNSAALVAASPEHLLEGLLLTVKDAAIRTADRLR